jgi:two-component system secretion system response regulator SalR
MAIWQSDPLTRTEKHLLKLLSVGRTKSAAASAMRLSHHTLDGILRRVFQKLQVHSAVEAVARALREGEIE